MKIINYIFFLLAFASCGVFTKIGKHTKHEVHAAAIINEQSLMSNESIIKGDSIIRIDSKTIEATLPFMIDTNDVDALDSLVSDDVKVYFKPVYHIPHGGKMVFKGMQVKAVIPAKVIAPNYTVTQKSSSNINTTIAIAIDSTLKEQTIIKKSDSRMGGYTTIVVIISLLCVGWFIATRIMNYKL